MYYILNKNVALRSWWLVPYAYYFRHSRTALGLKKEEFELLSLCDGLHDIEPSTLTERMVSREMIFPVQKGAVSLTEWQKPLVCDNRYMPSMNWMITGKCNYNCLHCFNAADNAPLQSEFSMEEADKLLDDAQKCGINAFTVTGGEPMAHKHFLDIVRGIYRRGMYIFELNTNGYYINREILDEMKKIECDPLVKISFDGLGYHDWMRGREGAEQDAMRAIKLCIENGFRVKVQMNINRKNAESILPSLELLDGMGVWETRVICTTPAPRWEQNAAGQCLEIPEYIDKCLEIASEYIKKPHRMYVDFWQYMNVDPNTKCYSIRALSGCEAPYRDSLPLCKGNRGMIAVASTGEVYPCLQMSGWMEQHGVTFGNVKKQGLQQILQSGDYLNEVCATVGDLKKVNKKCADCKHFKVCLGGCRALGALTNGGDMRGSDQSKCCFFKNGYVKKTEAAMAGYKNLTPYDVD